MFAYCGNNPSNCVDPEGQIWYYLIVDHDMGFVHRMVQAHICSTSSSNIRAELVLTGFGRADIVDTERGVVWEVKHAGKIPAERRAEARIQATGYIGGEQKGVVIIGLGEANAFSGNFYIKCEEYYFWVEYNTQEAGVILYSVKESKEPNLSTSIVYVYVPKGERNQSSSTQGGLWGGLGLGICAIAFPDTGNQSLSLTGGYS